jgi:hypothetical protein
MRYLWVQVVVRVARAVPSAPPPHASLPTRPALLALPLPLPLPGLALPGTGKRPGGESREADAELEPPMPGAPAGVVDIRPLGRGASTLVPAPVRSSGREKKPRRW